MLRQDRSRRAKFYFSFFFLIICSCPVCADPAFSQYAAVVEPARRFQIFEGWGTSLAWWGNIVGGFPDPYRSDYLTEIFDPRHGLGLTIVRYNIGGGEAPGLNYLSRRAAVPGYEPSAGHWDWSADANQREILSAALKMGVTHIEAFSNSPPYWMTLSGSVTGAQNGSDNLDPTHTLDFSDYLATVTQHFQTQWGITFRTVEPLNEPISPWWRRGIRQEGCHFSRSAQAAVIYAVGRALAAKGLHGTTVSAPDENSIDETLKSWQALGPQAQAQVGQINTHSYGGTARADLRLTAATSGKRLWMSEYGDGDASGMTLSQRILADMNGLHPAAWVYWQAVDGGGWGLLVNPEDGTHFSYTINEKYYVMANYSRFIRPGDTLIAIDDTNSLAAYNGLSHKLVIVTTNATDSAVAVTYDLSQFRHLAALVQAYRTSAAEHLSPLPNIATAARRFQSTLPPRSVTTFVLTAAGY